MAAPAQSPLAKGARLGGPTEVYLLWASVFSFVNPNLSYVTLKGSLNSGGQTLWCEAS